MTHQYALTMRRYAPNHHALCPHFQAPGNIEKCRLGIGNLKVLILLGIGWELVIWEIIAKNRLLGRQIGKQKP